jgi:transposase-like protein
MPGTGHSEEEIVYALRQIEGGKKVSEVCREMGVSLQAVYRVEASVRRIGIARGSRATATARRESQAERDCCRSHVGQTHPARGALKKSLKPAVHRELVREIRQAYPLNESRACGLVRITRWSNRYQTRHDPQSELRVRLRDLAPTRIRYGYRRLTVLLLENKELRRDREKSAGWRFESSPVHHLFSMSQLPLAFRSHERTAPLKMRQLGWAHFAGKTAK